ncbi:preprotein translocase subunit SecE [Aneurinibacillus thermoaerophilus]|uniref:preprotein translocase subunit SecE n=1 Tax=Aneurinibacillus thermoaerophilus TaxID=143495 RepID=UPI002E227A43|nr:preprotein translocase subunit SecE [Aneurinibacillus thermoaerophilus]MED0764550.1 preprotein translocase subunit SecE [Aneurinibacillus thermoaerophilus]
MGFVDKLKRGPAFVKEAWAELKKVTWPTRKELVSYTTVVLVTVTLIAIFFAVIDLGISQLLKLILKAGK